MRPKVLSSRVDRDWGAVPVRRGGLVLGGQQHGVRGKEAGQGIRSDLAQIGIPAYMAGQRRQIPPIRRPGVRRMAIRRQLAGETVCGIRELHLTYPAERHLKKGGEVKLRKSPA